MSSLNGASFLLLGDNVTSPATPQTKSYKPTRLAAKDRLIGGESEKKVKKAGKMSRKSSFVASHASERRHSTVQPTLQHSASKGNIKGGHQHHSQKYHASSHGKGAPNIDLLTNLTDEKLQILSRVEVSSPEVPTLCEGWGVGTILLTQTIHPPRPPTPTHPILLAPCLFSPPFPNQPYPASSTGND